MPDAVIENPILNSPFREPKRHWRFGEQGITSDVVDERRISSYFMPIPAAKKTAQLAFDTEWTRDRIEENTFINRVRERVGLWRAGGWPGATPTTRRLLEYWTDGDRERPLFFCQIEALETAIYLTEVASKVGDAWILNDLKRYEEDANPDVFRVAFKMATGSGKTVVMAMLVAWQALNKFANAQDARFSDAFLIVTPGITIRDRLRVLLPADSTNYYRERDLVTADQLERLGEARIVITNFHAFKPRDRSDASRTTKLILGGDSGNPFVETPDQVVRRVCRALGSKRGIIVLNDEAHHCYRHRSGGDANGDVLRGDERKDAERREEEARVWISGLEAVQRKIGVKTVYDLSATPFFLRGSGYPEGTLFPWVVSDFSLIDAIESGVVKIPRVPVSDNSMDGLQPTYRDLWIRIRDELPKKSRKESGVGGEPRLPAELQGALHSLYGNYERAFKRWQESQDADSSATPPVFIVVCNNTSVSKLVFDYIAGWEKEVDGGAVVVPGALELFSNEENGLWRSRARTILVDSQQLESGEAMTDDFKKIARTEIDEFKAEYAARYPGRDPDDLTDEDLLREVMNTVGKPGKLGEPVRCVVSVSMLTEGWDANTVTHILGVRAFGTQLLCEQVIGRGLRRVSYVTNDQELFEPEYAEVYGVPFSFIPTAGAAPDPKPGPMMTRVRALEDRIACEITFPRITGYRYELAGERLHVRFDDDSLLALSTQHVPTKTDLAPIVGASDVHTLDDLRDRREQEVAFFIARRVLQRYFDDRPWLFPQLAAIARQFIGECVSCKDNTFPQLLLLHEVADDVADRIYKAIVHADPGEKKLLAVPAPYDPVGSTRTVDFDTAKPVMETDPTRCHLSHVVCDTQSWEQKMAQVFENMGEVRAYVKNQGLGFMIPYTIDGEQRNYLPDFIARVDDGQEEELNLIVEVSGAARRDKAAKVATARTLWVPAVNNLREYGRWAFVEISDPWDAENTIRALLSQPMEVAA